MLIVSLEEHALKQLVARAFETLNLETAGVVYGEVGKNKYYVDSIEVLVSAKRKPTTIKTFDSAEKRFKSIMGQGIGGFHSHSLPLRRNGNLKETKVFFSKLDLGNIRHYYPDKIEIITSLNSAENMTRPRASDFRTTGCFYHKGEKYRFEIGAYYLSPGEDVEHRWPRRALLSVPVSALRRAF